MRNSTSCNTEHSKPIWLIPFILLYYSCQCKLGPITCKQLLLLKFYLLSSYGFICIRDFPPYILCYFAFQFQRYFSINSPNHQPHFIQLYCCSQESPKRAQVLTIHLQTTHLAIFMRK